MITPKSLVVEQVNPVIVSKKILVKKLSPVSLKKDRQSRSMTKILDLRAACRALGEISGKKQKVNGAVNRDLGEIVENTQNVN